MGIIHDGEASGEWAVFSIQWSVVNGTGRNFLGGGIGGKRFTDCESMVIAYAMQKPAAKRMSEIGKEIQASGGPPSSEQMAELQAQRKKLEKGARWSAILLAITVAGRALSSTSELMLMRSNSALLQSKCLIYVPTPSLCAPVI